MKYYLAKEKFDLGTTLPWLKRNGQGFIPRSLS